MYIMNVVLYKYIAITISTECVDDPSYECKDMSQTEGFCKEQEKFTREHCALSCGWCG